MVICLDASALVPLFVEDAHSAAARSRLVGGGTVAGVSTFAAAELAGAVGRLVRGRAVSPPMAAGLLSEFDAWLAAHAATLEMDATDHRVAGSFVRRFDLWLRTPDALHIAVCRRLGLPLLTFDRRQAAAATALGVTCDPAGATGAA